MSKVFNKLSKDPVDILDKNVANNEVLSLVKEFFDPIAKGNSVLEEIFIDGLDASQVWSQAKIILDSTAESLLFEKIPSLKKKVGTILEEEEVESELEELSDDPSDAELNSEGQLVDDFEEEPLSGEEDNGEQPSENEELKEEEQDDKDSVSEGEEEVDGAINKDAFGLNDEFFSIDDFNKQILAQESGNVDNGDDDIDYFNDIPDSDEEDEEILYYNDFFSKPKSRKDSHKKNHKRSLEVGDLNEKKEANEDLDEEDYERGMQSAMMDLFDDEKVELPKENLSSFERQQQQIQKEISQLESEAIAEKKWALKGESKAKDRPADSLINEELEFERTAKPVPVITKEVTESLEEMIRRRIKEENFDDLPKRIMSDVTNFRPSSDFQLSETKSTKSLAELYEDQYKGTDSSAEVSEELQKAHDEIKNLYQSLSHKLDALCSAHFIPKPAQKSIDIKVNAPSISMEDAQPLTQSSASRLAPQEIFKTKSASNDTEIQLKSGTVFARDELSREDKQRLRRAGKRKRAKEFQSQDPDNSKKSKKQSVIDTLSKANNVTIINNKGEKRDVSGALKKDKSKQGTTMLKL